MRLRNEDKVLVYLWTLVFVGSNIAIFITTLLEWTNIVETFKNGLRKGNLDISCESDECALNRQLIKKGPISDVAPWAKASGKCLDFNCMLILLPVTRILLRRLYNLGKIQVEGKRPSLVNFIAKMITQFIPLQKNIEFHKLCASMIFLFSWMHMIFHFINLFLANETTLYVFNRFGWIYWAWFSGAIIVISMFFIYGSAFEGLRYTKYEAFFNAHHWFGVFFFFLFLHAPTYWQWGLWPALLYCFERLLQKFRGKIPFALVKVEWISPVMAIYFRPLIKDDFKFKEGQYLYLNCPGISNQWHPFTISSAVGDLDNGPRIHLESGEEVVEVPRPPASVWPADSRWSKYCRVSQDWRKEQINNPHGLLDKSETGYFDYVSVHIKVHGLDTPTAHTWTRKLKEYFEMLCPPRGGAVEAFPMHFIQRDNRGDLVLGRHQAPTANGGMLPIIRVDGPHSAPAEHYHKYQTVMLVGAGIGLTPCASILTGLIKYRWKRSINPDILHFYWVIRLQEIDSFQWLVHMLTELSYDLKRSKENRMVEKHNYCEINIYVTGADPKTRAADGDFRPTPLKRATRKYSDAFSTPGFSAEQLYALLLNPTVDSRTQIDAMRSPATAKNRLQNIWVWNGRPQWDLVFNEMRAQRMHDEIGVCFCGTPVIGLDLKKCCDKYSSIEENVVFHLHKENF